MGKLRDILPPSLVLGLVISITATVACMAMIHTSEFVYDIEGHRHLNSKSLLSSHPWFVVALVTGTAAVINLFDCHYRKGLLRWPTIATGLLSLVLPIMSMSLLVEYGHIILPSKDPQPDIPAIQQHLFGEHGIFLREADKVTLYSTDIHPYQPAEGTEFPELFHGHQVFGSIDIDDPEQILAIGADIQGRIHWDTDVSVTVCCFWPRHGLRAYRGNEVRDYLACFECAKLYIFTDVHSDEPEFIALETGIRGEDTSSHLLNGILDQAGIHRAKSPCE